MLCGARELRPRTPKRAECLSYIRAAAVSGIEISGRGGGGARIFYIHLVESPVSRPRALSVYGRGCVFSRALCVRVGYFAVANKRHVVDKVVTFAEILIVPPCFF